VSTKDEAKRFVRGRGYRLKDFDAAQDFFFLMAAFADEQAKTQTSLLQEAREHIEAELASHDEDEASLQSCACEFCVWAEDFLERSEVK